MLYKIASPRVAIILGVILLGGVIFLFGYTPDTKDTRLETKCTGVCSTDMIVLDSPGEGDTVSAPLSIEGRARGGWYFEASFPVDVTDSRGVLLGQGYATATGEWMTSDFVPFTASLHFNAAEAIDNIIYLVLRRDNPSGLPEGDGTLSVPLMIPR